jgi:hypothetical protein
MLVSTVFKLGKAWGASAEHEKYSNKTQLQPLKVTYHCGQADVEESGILKYTIAK